MKRWLSLASVACFSLFAACNSNDDGGDYPPGTKPPEATKIPERDGIPSTTAADRLLYYVSTHEDAPGLYAYHPASGDQPPAYIDPEMNVVTPFHHALHSGTLDPDGSIRNFHIGGVFYLTYYDDDDLLDLPDTYAGLAHIVATDTTQLQTSPTQVTNETTAANYIQSVGGLFSFNLHDIHRSSFLTYSANGPIRYDMDMAATEAALALPEGRALLSYLGESGPQHEHWLYTNEDHELVFFNRDFTASTAVIDEDTNAPVVNVSEWSLAVGALSAADQLVVLADQNQSESEGLVGTLYRISRPTDAYPGGSAKKLRNADGDVLEFGVGPFVLGRSVPREPQLYVRNNAAYFADGPSMFNDTWTSLTRADRDSWTSFSHKQALIDEGVSIGMSMMQSMLPPIFIYVDGHGTFWAPGRVPELIEPSDSEGQSWKRTKVNVPVPEKTTIFSSANGWIYYDYEGPTHDGALAYHVPSKETLTFPRATWIGASSNGNSHTISSVSATELSEVFLLLQDRRLVALEAGAPSKGMVILGTLPSTTEALQLFGAGRGPHRLLQLIHEDDSAEVLYVDTRSKGSLKHLMPAAASEWKRPLILLDTDIGQPVSPQNTRPVSLF